MAESVTLPLSVRVLNQQWSLHLIEYDGPDGTFIAHIYALSHDHAMLLLDDLKRTGRVLGRVGDAWQEVNCG